MHEHLKTNNITRAGIKDLWNAYLLDGAQWSKTGNPIVKTTATAPPKAVISYKDANNIDKLKRKTEPYYKIDAFIHFYIDDDQFDCKTSGIWGKPEEFFRIASHFAGVIGPDFSINADFPPSIKTYQIYRMRTIEYASAQRNIPVVINARFGSEATWYQTIDEFPENSMLAIDTVGSRLKYLENRYCFDKGFERLPEKKHPHTLIVVGSSNYHCFEKAKAQGLKIVQFDGDTCKYFKKRKERKDD